MDGFREYSGSIRFSAGLLFFNDLPDTLESLTLLFEDDVKIVTPQTEHKPS